MKLTGFPTVIGNAKPTFVDISLSTIVYEGYESGSTFIICKIDLSTTVVSRTWATGKWEDRATLNYN